MMFSRALRVHFVGIGGIGMSGIAEVLLVLGWSVSGSDLRMSPITERLQKLGARIDIGHAAENVRDAEVVVISSAVSAENPEVVEARRLLIPVIPRAEMLAELMRLKFGIAVGGMHGKTTTTSMIATLLAAANLDPTVVVGGRLDSIGSNARLGTSQYLVAEADESDRSFLKLSPILSVITNIDREHLDCYRDLDDIQAAFVEFANHVPFYGTVVIGADQPEVRAILPRIQRRTLTYGQAEDMDLQVGKVELGPFSATFELTVTPYAARLLGRDQVPSTSLGEFHLRVPGLHNVLDATAAIAVGLLLGRDLDVLRAAITQFGGVDRRFQRRGEAGGVTVIDDYGHHPTEVAATLAAAKQCGFRRVLILFQPHRYTRTYHLRDEFVAALAGADRSFLLDIYPAGEKPIAGVSAEALVAQCREGGVDAEYVGDADTAVRRIAEVAQPGDLIITQGAGSVSLLGDRILQALQAKEEPAGVKE